MKLPEDHSFNWIKLVRQEVGSVSPDLHNQHADV